MLVLATWCKRVYKKNICERQGWSSHHSWMAIFERTRSEWELNFLRIISEHYTILNYYPTNLISKGAEWKKQSGKGGLRYNIFYR